MSVPYVPKGQDPEAAAPFWSAALRYRNTDRGGAGVDIARDATAWTILLIVSMEPKRGTTLIHLDPCTTDRDQSAEVELHIVGASRVDIDEQRVSWVVLADSSGHEFLRDAEPPEPQPFHHLDPTLSIL